MSDDGNREGEEPEDTASMSETGEQPLPPPIPRLDTAPGRKAAPDDDPSTDPADLESTQRVPTGPPAVTGPAPPAASPDATVVTPVPPPGATAPPPAAPAVQEDLESTRLGSTGPPPVALRSPSPEPPTPPASEPERTGEHIAPPPTPQVADPAPSAPRGTSPPETAPRPSPTNNLEETLLSELPESQVPTGGGSVTGSVTQPVPIPGPRATESLVVPEVTRLEFERLAPGFKSGERIPIDPRAERLMIGRGESADIALVTGSASREHAVLMRDAQGGWQLVPVASKIVHIDGHEVSQPVSLAPGAKIQMGEDMLRLQAAADPAGAGLLAGINPIVAAVAGLGALLIAAGLLVYFL